MILDHAVPPVRAGDQQESEAAFATARRLLAGAAGFRWLPLPRRLERGTGYLLLVEWNSVEDHTDGFRGSAAHQEWTTLLHHFSDPFPVVEHYATVLTADSQEDL
ncbi:antibiotic biosynthesis monooxygenase family protein [Blastococcus atacamensis]|uniref:antibiotic biosynthesis monooxygenase family protein n=1 Tax=Blastococcus atacamensis TaxID=2070508 RepID=UPI000CECD70B|nr:antibiotic biosynthesis monooxygenase [Blastococcus atacamensis]